MQAHKDEVATEYSEGSAQKAIWAQMRRRHEAEAARRAVSKHSQYSELAFWKKLGMKSALFASGAVSSSVSSASTECLKDFDDTSSEALSDSSVTEISSEAQSFDRQPENISGWLNGGDSPLVAVKCPEPLVFAQPQVKPADDSGVRIVEPPVGQARPSGKPPLMPRRPPVSTPR